MTAGGAAAAAEDAWVPSEVAQRTVTAIALAVPAAAAVVAGPPYLTVFVGIVAAVMSWEWVRVTGARKFGVAGATMAALLVGAVAAAAFGRYAWAYGIVAAAIPLVYAAARFHAREHALPIAAGAAYIGVPALSLLWLYARPEVGRELVIWIICVVIACDIGAFFVGRTLRGPKLAPRISPGKTIEGAWGALAGGAIVAVAGAWLFGEGGLGLALLVGVGLLAIVFSIVGDLFESLLKRHVGAKDSGALIPGHGGVLDRIDGVLAALPVFFLGKEVFGF